MKNLLDIQQDVRRLENSMREIAENMEQMNADIDELRNGNRSTDIEFSKIEILAGYIKFRHHPLSKLENKRICQLYLEMLLNIVRLEKDRQALINSLIFLQWLQIQAKEEWQLEYLYMGSFRMNKEEYYEFAKGLPQTYREVFIVDALLTAYMGESVKQEILDYIADQSVLLGVDREKLRILAVVARAVLCQNLTGVGKEDIDGFLKYAASYDYYVDSQLIKEALQDRRDLVVAVSDADCAEFSWSVGNLEQIKTGDIIAVYLGKDSVNSRRRNAFTRYAAYERLSAPSSGTLFQFRDKNTNYGVISNASDDKASIKAWVRAKRKE